MKRTLFLALSLPIFLASRCTSEALQVSAVGSRAYEFTKELTALGPRPPGSSGIEQARGWVGNKTSALGFALSKDLFVGDTPIGKIDMVNLFYTIPGTQGRDRVVLMAHYDSKRFVGFDFVGANDAASSVALLLSLSPEIQAKKFAFDVEVVFVDGEEALSNWTATDSLYGSRHYAASISKGKPIRAAFVVDMISDPDLSLADEVSCDAALRVKLKNVLAEMGWSSMLETMTSAIDDDHRPLIAAGIPTLHLIDFDPESPGPIWHTASDVVENVSMTSLSAVGEILLRLLTKL